METVEEGRSAFKTIEDIRGDIVKEAREISGEINGLVNQGKEAGKELVIQGKEVVNQGKEAGKEVVNKGKEVVSKVEKAVKEATEEDNRSSIFGSTSESSGSDKKIKK